MDIFILEPITQALAKGIVVDINRAKGRDIDVHIMSMGGDILAGNAIASALINSPSKVTTKVIGISASMASVISQAGDVRLIAPDASFNIHNGSMGKAPGRGTKEDHQQAIDVLEKMDSSMIKAFKRSGLQEEDIKNLMEIDTLLTADEAIALGFFDGYAERVQAVAELNQNKKEMSKFTELLAKVDTAAIAMGIRKSDDEAKQVFVDELKTKLKGQVDQVIEEKEKMVEAQEDTSGADILTSEMVSREEFEMFKAEIMALIAPLLETVQELPSPEETTTMVEETTTAKLDAVLTAIKSKTRVPQASQNFQQPEKAEAQDWSVLEAKRQEIAHKNKR